MTGHRRRFYLVRHAKAEATAAGGDAARRLTEKGRAAFVDVARVVAREARITRIVTSPYTRARETAELLARATGAPLEEDPRLASGASSGRALLELAAELGPGAALVGHNPELAEAIHLAGGGTAEVPPGTVAAVEGGKVAWVKTR
jgi:phosphohistidine phosphatase